MKSGNRVHVNCSAAEYTDHHRVDGCDGEWALKVVRDEFYPAGDLGAIQVSHMPFIVCPKCQAAFFPPGFQGWFDRNLAESLVFGKGLLDKRQLRFLRIHFELTQEQVAAEAGITDRHYYSKMESLNSTTTMPEAEQFKLRVLYAKLLGVATTEQIYGLLKVEDSFNKLISPVMPSEDELMKRYAVG